MKYVITAILIGLGLAISVPMVAHSATISNTDTTINFKGEIISGDAKRLEALILRTGIKTVEFDSNGGMAIEGYTLGYVIRRNEVKTVVIDGSVCLSACAVAYIGGVDLELDGVLGFHVAWSPVDDQSYSDGMKSGQLYSIVGAAYHFNMGYTNQMSYIISQVTDSKTFLILSLDDLKLFTMVDKDFTEYKELPKHWVYERIADPLRMYMLKGGY